MQNKKISSEILAPVSSRNENSKCQGRTVGGGYGMNRFPTITKSRSTPSNSAMLGK